MGCGLLNILVVFLAGTAALMKAEDTNFRKADALVPTPWLANHLMRYAFPALFPENKVYVCSIPKNGQAQIHNFLCSYHYGYNATINKVKGFLALYKKCQKKIRNDHADHIKSIDNITDWQRLVLTRDPVHRLVSAYTNICGAYGESGKRPCYGCKDFACFVEKNQEGLAKISKTTDKMGKGLRQKNHFYPQFWFCGFPLGVTGIEQMMINEDFEIFGQAVRQKFTEFGFDPALVNATLFVDQPYHTKHPKSDPGPIYEQLHRNRTLTEQIYNTYRVDYDYFKFPLPDYAMQFCIADPTWKLCQVGFGHVPYA